MNTSERQLLEFISRLTYNIEGLSLSLKLYISQVLTYHFSENLSEDFIRDIENKKAARRFKNAEEVRNAAADFSVEQKAWCIGVLMILRDQAEKTGNTKLSIYAGKEIDRLTELFGLSGKSIIDQQRQQLEKEIDQYQNRKVIRIPAAIWPLALDFLIRSLLLVYSNAFARDTSTLIALNVTVIPAIILLIGFIASRRDRKFNMNLLESYGGAHQFKIESSISVGQYNSLAFFLATSVFISYLIPSQLHALAFFGLTIYYFVFLRFFHVGRLDENDLMKQLENNVGGRRQYDIDQNDEEIVGLETRLNSFTSRLDAYVLESALFGALTFSGFLQIMASDLVSFNDLENFATSVFNASRGVINLDPSDFENGLAGLNNKVSLLCLVSVESLICSGFFLAVIASRLRFSDVADRVRTSIEMAKVYNAKEEALASEHEVTERKPGRLNDLTNKVGEQIHAAIVAIERVNPVMMYMRYFRNAGILVFLMILVTSSLFITGVLGWTFLAVAAGTYVYFNYSKLNVSIRAALLDVRITFNRRTGWFFAFSIAPFILWALIAPLSPSAGNTLLALGYVTLSVYIFAWLIFASHADPDFGDIEDKKAVKRTGRWLLVKSALAFSILMWGVANAFKQLHLSGADQMIFISLTSTAILMYFVGYYLSKIRWLGVICGWTLAVVAMGVLFRTFHLGGAYEMMLVAAMFLFVITPFVIWKRKSFHGLFLRLITISVILTALLASGLLLKIQLAILHRTSDVEAIEEVMYYNNSVSLDSQPEALHEAFQKCDWYINKYGIHAGYSPVYAALVRNYTFYLASNFEDKPGLDSATLTRALDVARQATKIRKLFGYKGFPFTAYKSTAEARILIQMGRKDEARKFLEDLLLIAPDADFKRDISEQLSQIPR